MDGPSGGDVGQHSLFVRRDSTAPAALTGSPWQWL